jgi:hypothetical protein
MRKGHRSVPNARGPGYINSTARSSVNGLRCRHDPAVLGAIPLGPGPPHPVPFRIRGPSSSRTPGLGGAALSGWSFRSVQRPG